MIPDVATKVTPNIWNARLLRPIVVDLTERGNDTPHHGRDFTKPTCCDCECLGHVSREVFFSLIQVGGLRFLGSGGRPEQQEMLV